MNQDQLKELLLKLKPDARDFSVTYSGKASRKKDGLYYPAKQEIIIHNKNFTDDDSLIMTAVHELAHHIMFTEHEGVNAGKNHTTAFYKVWFDLMDTAESLGQWKNAAGNDALFYEIDLVKEQLRDVAAKQIDLGKDIVRLMEVAQKYHFDFDYLVRRYLRMKPVSIKNMLKLYCVGVPTIYGPDAALEIAKVNDPVKRQELRLAIDRGQSLSQAKSVLSKQTIAPVSERDQIAEKMQEINKLGKQVQKITQKMKTLQIEVEEMKENTHE